MSILCKAHGSLGLDNSLTDGYMPNPEAEWGHDPHFMTACAAQPEHVWQQNHCGVFYRLRPR